MEEAFLRLASLPVKFPILVRQTFERLPVEERFAFINHMAERRISPLARLHLFALWIDCSAVEQASAAKVLALAASPDLVAEWDLYQALLRWSHDWLVVSEGKDRIDTPALIAASWIHASRSYEALSEKYAVPELQVFCNGDRPTLAFWGFEAELARPRDVAHPYSVTRARLLVLGVANLLTEVRISEEILLQLKALRLPIYYPGGVEGPPAHELLSQRTTLNNGLDSFLGSGDADSLAKAIGSEFGKPLSDAANYGSAPGRPQSRKTVERRLPFPDLL